jgi:hypothetical protein
MPTHPGRATTPRCCYIAEQAAGRSADEARAKRCTTVGQTDPAVLSCWMSPDPGPS